MNQALLSSIDQGGGGRASGSPSDSLQQRCEQTNDADDYAEDGGQEDEPKVSDR